MPLKDLEKRNQEAESELQSDEESINSNPNLLDKIRENPIKLFSFLDPPIVFCAQLKELFYNIFNNEGDRFSLLKFRGGGGTLLGACVGVSCFALNEWDIYDAAGSLDQALTGFEYASRFLNLPPFNQTVAGGITLKTKAEGIFGNKYLCFPASPKAIRGKHPTQKYTIDIERLIEEWETFDISKVVPTKGRGALLLIDEEAEIEDKEILPALWGIISNAEPGIILRLSTAHKAVGSFKELIDDPAAQGYKHFKIDAFDTIKDKPVDWSDYLDSWARDNHKQMSDTKKKMMMNSINSYWGKRDRSDFHGHIQTKNIINALYEMDSITFDVEFMAGTQASENVVIPGNLIDEALIDEIPEVQGGINVMEIDWGFSGMTAILVANCYGNDDKQYLDAKEFHRISQDVIFEYIKFAIGQYQLRLALCDSSHKFENDMLRKLLPVQEVVFSQEKESNYSKMLWRFQNHKVKIPKAFTTFILQLKKLHRINGKIVKREDHCPDAASCGESFNYGSMQMPRVIPRKEPARYNRYSSDYENVTRKLREMM